MSRFLQRVYCGGEEGKHPLRRDRIEQVTNLIIAWNLPHPEQTESVAASLRHVQVALGIQERRALGEEYRERSKGGILHGIGRMIAAALIWTLLNARAKQFHSAVEIRGMVVESIGKAQQDFCRHKLSLSIRLPSRGFQPLSALLTS